jgi:hypothetical protein
MKSSNVKKKTITEKKINSYSIEMPEPGRKLLWQVVENSYTNYLMRKKKSDV